MHRRRGRRLVKMHGWRRGRVVKHWSWWRRLRRFLRRLVDVCCFRYGVVSRSKLQLKGHILSL